MEQPGCPVLVVEDDADTREVVRDVLHDDGFEVVTAANGADGLAHLRLGRRPCAVVLDLMLPEVDGREVLEAMANDPELSDVPVVVITANVHMLTREYTNVRRIFRKPFPFLGLVKEVKQACGGKAPH